MLLVIGVLALFVWPWQNERAAELQGALRAALRPLAGRAGPVPELGRRPARLLHRGRGERHHHAAATSSSSPRAAASSRSPRPAAAASTSPTTAASSSSTRASATSRTRATARRRCRASRATARWRASGSSIRARPCRRRRGRRSSCCASRPPSTRASWPGASGWCWPRRNMLLLGIGLSATNPRRASNWNLLFALLGFVVVLQPHQPDAGLGRRRPARPRRRPARHPRRRVRARRSPCSGGASTGSPRRRDGAAPRPAAAGNGGAGRRMKTVRRLFYADIVSAVAFVALAFLPLFFFIDFVDELGRHRPARLHRAARGRLLAAARAGPPLRAAADRGADRHHLRAGAAGAVVAVHDPAHRRPRPGPRARPAGRAGAVFGAITFVVGDYLAPLSENVASQLRAALPRQPQARALGRLAQGAADTPGRRAQLLDQRRLGRRRLGPAPGAHLRVRRRRPAALAHQRGRGQGRMPTAAGRSRTSSSRAGATPAVDSTARAGAARLARLAEHALAQVVAAAVLPVTTMSTVELWRYIGHLAENEQAAQRTRSSSGSARSTRSPAW